ncbi:MAG: alpha/beta fold hydrolase [Parvibaculaceae bacterium]
MQHFDSDGVKIAYAVEGKGEPILLIHGFASNGRVNWTATGWVKFLTDCGRQVITIDNRGHGVSEKLYDSASYAAPAMAEDSRRLLDHLGIETADIMGYSMGARLTALLAIAHPSRVRRAVLGGLAENMILGVPGARAVSEALLAPSLDDVSDPQGRAFRAFADQSKSDRRALAACILASRQTVSADQLGRISCPVLVVVGETDLIAGKMEPLVAAIPNAQGVLLPRRDHMRAVGDAGFKQAVKDFLKQPL